MQKGLDEEVNSGITDDVELPVQREIHFEKFEINDRKAESKEEVKQAISIIEKEALLLNLIPMSFNKDLESERAIKNMLINPVYVQNLLNQKYFIEYDSTGKQPTCPCIYQGNPHILTEELQNGGDEYNTLLHDALLYDHNVR